MKQTKMSKVDKQQSVIQFPPEPDTTAEEISVKEQELIESSGDLAGLVKELLLLDSNDMLDRLYTYLKQAKLHSRPEGEDVRFRVPKELATLYKTVALGTNNSIEDVLMFALIAFCKERISSNSITPDGLRNQILQLENFLMQLSNAVSAVTETVAINTFANLNSTQETSLTDKEVQAAADSLQLEFRNSEEEDSND